jgi:hypothetical protein
VISTNRWTDILFEFAGVDPLVTNGLQHVRQRAVAGQQQSKRGLQTFYVMVGSHFVSLPDRAREASQAARGKGLRGVT